MQLRCRAGDESSSFVSFTQFFPTCGRMPLPALSVWPGRQPCRPRLVDGRRGGGPSSVAPRSLNPPTEMSDEGILDGEKDWCRGVRKHQKPEGH